MNEPSLTQRSILPTISLNTVGILGFLLNAYSANLALSRNENILGLIVSLSIAMIGIGFIPNLLK